MEGLIFDSLGSISKREKATPLLSYDYFFRKQDTEEIELKAITSHRFTLENASKAIHCDLKIPSKNRESSSRKNGCIPPATFPLSGVWCAAQGK